MSFLKTWTFSLNVTPTINTTAANTEQSFLMQFMNFLIANGWTADGSSNSSATSSTTNITTYTDWVKAATGTAHSWQILKSPVGIIAGLDGTYTGAQSQIWMVLDANSATVGSDNIEYFLIKPTGGTTTTTPTDANSALGFTNAGMMRASATSGALFHFAATSVGHFWAGITYSSSGKMPTFLALLPTTSPVQFRGHDYPYAIAPIRSYLDSANHPVPATIIATNAFKGWNEGGVTDSKFALMVMGCNLGAIGYGSTGGVNRSGIADCGVGYLYNQGTGPIAQIADFEFTGAAALPNGSTDAATVTRVAFGQIWLPANAAISD